MHQLSYCFRANLSCDRSDESNRGQLSRASTAIACELIPVSGKFSVPKIAQRIWTSSWMHAVFSLIWRASPSLSGLASLPWTAVCLQQHSNVDWTGEKSSEGAKHPGLAVPCKNPACSSSNTSIPKLTMHPLLIESCLPTQICYWTHQDYGDLAN